MPAPQEPRSRNKPDGILEAVAKGGKIQVWTLLELVTLLAATKRIRHFHLAVEVQRHNSALLKTIDNEEDALETIRLLKTTVEMDRRVASTKRRSRKAR